ncbi:hypothetical protein M430DRAFT_212915 [Amorphotheca resinae ATCC 22711]|uniref:Uncharacterized protein n=1 Tax=Amorphotheca resinae ATCC 22711 TaxID=857342 RepID=A0A2T3B895_AMORE|nr:hypothetical protein M430DRAFT_212915 [Amorphotheca resinae ATCC 22711]PSS23085.1 hypothetical protein M430DRAFT_212915 [Amorphotheca resinae ATCC 22711]
MIHGPWRNDPGARPPPSLGRRASRASGAFSLVGRGILTSVGVFHCSLLQPSDRFASQRCERARSVRGIVTQAHAEIHNVRRNPRSQCGGPRPSTGWGDVGRWWPLRLTMNPKIDIPLPPKRPQRYLYLCHAPASSMPLLLMLLPLCVL